MNNAINETNAQYFPNRIVLLGDSIFDNSPYVEHGESVTEQLEAIIASKETHQRNDANKTKVSLLAVDGHVMSSVDGQIARAQSKFPVNKEYAFLSCGGNDLLGYKASGLLSIASNNIGEALSSLHDVREHFRKQYKHMLSVTLKTFPELTVCTIYDNIPTLSIAEKMALAIFNEVILREAAEHQLQVLDLRVICDHIDDYAPISPIEPSKYGAKKIAHAIFEQYTNNTKGPVICA
ncbi:SGNH/GDSL hydrolase family protein [Vibrio sp. B1Z05]|uniref:SGNH/GDSL hydrolase family protein n=1 Tax=Vibrio sp. B1Z05 TaxID=2654980 RepID=UPI00128D160F|nr:SGNH/GDSL hydrolase family protein [Vibrio sp. B1Z05]MPW35939.1 SGNH/GDSL hydrolase family protein [Vibrio sp. B1Z05]